MSDANFASLSSTLLARKGGAKPAMRPQSAVLGPVDGVAAAANLEDLGWNDMGEDSPDAMPAAAAPAANHASASLAESSLIKKPALPPLEEREDYDASELEVGQEIEEPRVVPITPLQKKDPSSGQNQVRESLDRIASQLDGKTSVEADNEDDEEFEEEIVEAAPVARVVLPKAIKPAPARSNTVAKGKRAAFTLRLDPERHLMLRLACTVRGSSAQQLVTDALDGLLAEMPEIAMLAAQVQRGPN
ncbi:hypothetical protein K3148_02355 [Qipengyuania aurantiaca]|uniref:Uncharacterized protein n=1 Tax=Qipengyuania aurantiaca TaxID=2867233 RepID=A0ABX8ZUG5_9SPHN|nr:hypothetical protein [Qipengyuania aurantiaca]QZD91288.1 hypothetical protein K3148_02355 [Qipengyuania aurantiaca]